MTGTASAPGLMAETTGRTGSWWDGRLFGLWVLVNSAAFLVIPVLAILLEHLASAATHDLFDDRRLLAVLIIAVVGAGTQGVILGRWQWSLLRRRVPALPRRRWVMATLVPAFFVWLAVISPAAVDILARGGDTLAAFANGIVQALVLGPLIGLSQATAFRGHTTRWAWWLAANVVTYLSGAALYEFGSWLQQATALPGRVPPFFPVVAFAIHGAFMLWVTAPAAITGSGPVAARSRRRASKQTLNVDSACEAELQSLLPTSSHDNARRRRSAPTVGHRTGAGSRMVRPASRAGLCVSWGEQPGRDACGADGSRDHTRAWGVP